MENLDPSAVAQRRLFLLGAEVLTDWELVSLVAGVRAAKTLQKHGLRALARVDPNELADGGWLGARATSRLVAAVALADRVHLAEDDRPLLKSPQQIHAWLGQNVADGRREVFRVLCFDVHLNLLRAVKVAEGGVDGCTVDPREAFAPALLCRASGVVLVHNHPSGHAEPSSADVALTQRLVVAGHALGIRVLDHLVLTRHGVVSFVARGLLAPSGVSATLTLHASDR